jgi:hypothetical protein
MCDNDWNHDLYVYYHHSSKQQQKSLKMWLKLDSAILCFAQNFDHSKNEKKKKKKKKCWCSVF